MNFNNKDLDKKLHIVLNKPLEHQITKEDLLSVVSLTFNAEEKGHNFKLFDFSDLRYFPNLKELHIYNYDINNINYIFNLQLLEILDLYNCSFKSLSNISNLKNLKSLDLINCNYNNLDNLEGLSNLKTLSVNNVTIESLDFLYNLNLERLNINNVKVINSFESILNNKNINLLSVINTNFDFNLLDEMKELKDLYISNNQYIKNKIIIDKFAYFGIKVFNEYGIKLGGDKNATS